jgi:mono/diheme cytochrome c family protein
VTLGARIQCRTAVPTPARRLLKLVGTIVGVAGLAALSGCGVDVKGDAAAGKQLFTQRCGSCHTLADAGTKGTIGPNLDDAFKQDVADGIGRDTIAGVVKKQIELPTGPEMPADLVKGKDADAVAAYVANVAGKQAGGTGTTGATGASDGGGGTAKANGSNAVQIPADSSGQLAYQFNSAEAKRGKVTLLSKNDSPVPHDISIRGGGVDQQGKEVSNGGTSKVTAELKPAKYEFYCSVPGHEQGGMKGTLTVR